MPKTKISEFDVDPANNTDINSINIAEGCAPSGINNAIRQLMSDLKEWQAGSQDIYITPAGSASAPSITTTGDTNTGIFFPAADTIAFTEGGAEVMRINSSGNVGIGTNSPAQKLHVASAGTTAIQVQNTASSGASYLKSTNTATTCNFGVDATGGYIETLGAYATVFYTNSAQRMIIDSSGNVGIGTSSPASQLDITKTGDAVISLTSSGVQRYQLITRSGGRFDFQDQSAGATRWSVDQSGNLLVGTTSVLYSSGQQGLSVKTNGGYALVTQPSSNNYNSLSILNASGTLIGSVYGSSTATNYNTSSDYRLKENIAPMTGALARVSALKPVTYSWKVDGSAGEGFIAHELQEVVPDCVTGEKDAVDAEGNPQYQGIDTSFLVATLTAAIQEQQAIITDLKARIEALETK